MKTCENHDDAICIYDFGKTCPWCEEVNNLKERIIELEGELEEVGNG